MSTNSTRFGTVVSYYCTSPRHELVGPKKITCLKDGSYNDDPPSCREVGLKNTGDDVIPLVLANPQLPRNNDQGPRRQPPSKAESVTEFFIITCLTKRMNKVVNLHHSSTSIGINPVSCSSPRTRKPY